MFLDGQSEEDIFDKSRMSMLWSIDYTDLRSVNDCSIAIELSFQILDL